MTQMLRHEAVSGAMKDLAHVVSKDMLADVLTKQECNEGLRALTKAVTTGYLPNVDAQPNFRDLIRTSHKAFFCSWIARNIDIDFTKDTVISFLGVNIQDEFHSFLGTLDFSSDFRP